MEDRDLLVKNLKKIVSFSVLATIIGCSNGSYHYLKTNDIAKFSTIYNGNISILNEFRSEKLNLIEIEKLSRKEYNRYMDKLNKEVAFLLKTMEKIDDKDDSYIWKELKNKDNEESILKNYQNIEKMSIAYLTPGTDYFSDPELLKKIAIAMEWNYDNIYNFTTEKREGVYAIALPKKLNDILLVMFDKLPAQNIAKYLSVLEFFQPNTMVLNSENVTGKDKSSLMTLVAQRALLTRNDGLLFSTKKDLEIQILDFKFGETLDKVDEFNGIIENVVFFQKTKHKISKESLDLLYKIARNDMAPLLHKGMIVDFISKDKKSKIGGDLIVAMANLSQYLERNQRVEIQRIVKSNLENNRSNYDLELNILDFGHSNLLKKIRENININGEKFLNGIYSMKKNIVAIENNYTFTSSLESNEDIILTDDISENLDYWSTLDTKYTPGVIVGLEKDTNVHRGILSLNNFAIMSNSKVGDKSIFLMKDEIYVLGNSVERNSKKQAYHTFLNYKFEKNNQIYVNDKKVNSWNSDKSANIYIEGNIPSSSRGIAFLGENKIKIFRDNRKGISEESGKNIKKKFITGIVDLQKKNEFAYGIFPNISKERFIKIVEENKTRLLFNNSEVQAIENKEKGILLATILKPGNYRIGDVVAFNRSNLIFLETEDGIEMKFNNTDPKVNRMKFLLNRDEITLDDKSENIIIEENGGEHIIYVDVKNSEVQSGYIKLKKKKII